MRLAALVSILILLLTSTASAQAPESENCPVPPRTICTPVVLNDIQINEETDGYTIDIDYPVLCSPDATRTIRDFVTRSLSDFKLNFPEHDLRDYPVKHEKIINYAVWSAGAGRFGSVELQVMVYTGGAHPNSWPVTWVFDMTDGRALDLDDVFINQRDALITLAPVIRDVLSRSLGEMSVEDMLNDGTRPVASNYDNYILTDEGMAFFFAPYQVAPYAAGEQVVTIPYIQLSELLKPEIKAIISY